MMDKEVISLITASLALLTAVLALVPVAFHLRKLRKDVSDLNVVIRDTHDLREALKKPFEGFWKVSGKFDEFQGKSTHFSSGEIIFRWNQESSQYDVKYIYSINNIYSPYKLFLTQIEIFSSLSIRNFWL